MITQNRISSLLHSLAKTKTQNPTKEAKGTEGKKPKLLPMLGKAMSPNDHGFILPLVLIISLIISTGLMAIAARSWLGLSGSVRQSQSRQAREIAEAGLARLIEELNSQFPYLLIKDYDPNQGDTAWNDNQYISSKCPGSSSGEPKLSDSVTSTNGASTEGRYTLIKYNFLGSPFYGGKADVVMRGEKLAKNGSVAATSTVEQTIEVRPKSCKQSFGEATNTSGFPGLLASNIDLGNNEIKGSLSANVLCTGCTTTEDFESLSQDQKEGLIGGNDSDNKSQVDGDIFIGPIDMPPIPPKPSELESKSSSAITRSTTIRGGETPTDPDIAKSCTVSEENRIRTTSCLISSISLKNEPGQGSALLTIDSTNGPVRLYITSPGTVSSPSVDFSGNAGIRHIRTNPTSLQTEPGLAADLALFGNPADTNSDNNQYVNLAGGSTVTGLWAYFPDGAVGIKGGNNNDPLYCDPTTGDCFGGEIVGAVWAKSWGGTKDLRGAGSSSGVAQLVVPSDMGTQLFNRFGPAYALGIRDYIALGISRWSSWTKP